MGNEQSGSTEAAPSFFDRMKGVGTPRLPRTDKIVVVRSASDKPAFDASQDENVLKLQDIPSFYPVLRSLLNLPQIKDPPDLHSKFGVRPLSLLAQRLQEHLNVTAIAVGNEQNAIANRLKEIDQILGSLCVRLNERKKAYERFEQSLHRVTEMHLHLKRTAITLQQIVPEMNEANQLLPKESRLGRLDLSGIVDQQLLCAMSRPLALDSPETDVASAAALSESDDEEDVPIDEQSVVDAVQST